MSRALEVWASSCPRPLVLFFDEIDGLQGDSLRSVLSQLRNGFPLGPDGFPASVVLCGLRDVRDYKAASGGDPTRLGSSSPFNVKVSSLRLGDFTADDVRELYGQHTAETGQVFTDETLERAFGYTQGQPWLVNALAREVVREMKVSLAEAITAKHIDEAKERLILARATHLDSLAARLQEPRVERVIEPLIAGDLPPGDPTFNDDVAYLRDLGLLAQGKTIEVANPIYCEVIVRVLASRTEASVTSDPRSFVILGYLHRIVNGRYRFRPACSAESVSIGGYIDREYGTGRGRLDLLIRWPYDDTDGKRA